jgi:tartrate-resistant acid phosphatase type 5
MPARHYYVDQGNARFVFVDTNLVVRDYGGFALDDEVAFVASMAADCETRLCFLVGHHPPVTAGMHRDDLAKPAYVARMATLLDAGGGKIRAFLAGHDHDLEHLRTPEGLDVLISGNGSGTRGAEKFSATSRQGTQLLFASLRWGFGVIEVGVNGWRYRFEGDDGSALYCCAAAATGPCEPVACR